MSFVVMVVAAVFAVLTISFTNSAVHAGMTGEVTDAANSAVAAVSFGLLFVIAIATWVVEHCKK